MCSVTVVLCIVFCDDGVVFCGDGVIVHCAYV